MSFNQEYLYSHLPARFRREDTELFLKRYLQFFGTTLDEWDLKFDEFHKNIDSSKADEIWVEFWLKELFGWEFFPDWFGIEEKRRLYGNFGKHLARRGTANGIELWMNDFNVTVRVFNRPVYFGEFVWGESVVSIAEPLRTIIEIFEAIPKNQTDISGFGDACYGESFYSEGKPVLTQRELADLLKFMQPHGQDFVIIWKQQRGNYE